MALCWLQCWRAWSRPSSFRGRSDDNKKYSGSRMTSVSDKGGTKTASASKPSAALTLSVMIGEQSQS